MKHFATTMLTFGIMLAALPTAHAADTTCPPSPPSGSTINGNLIVPANASCELDDGTVTGNVVVGTGASLSGFPVTGRRSELSATLPLITAILLAFQTFGDGMLSVGGNVNIQNCTSTGIQRLFWASSGAVR